MSTYQSKSYDNTVLTFGKYFDKLTKAKVLRNFQKSSQLKHEDITMFFMKSSLEYLMHNWFEIEYVMKFEKRTGKGLMVALNIPPSQATKKSIIKTFHLLQNKEG